MDGSTLGVNARATAIPRNGSGGKGEICRKKGKWRIGVDWGRIFSSGFCAERGWKFTGFDILPALKDGDSQVANALCEG